MSKLDLKKQLKEFQGASDKKPSILDIPESKFITITGRGAPGGPEESTTATLENHHPTTN